MRRYPKVKLKEQEKFVQAAIALIERLGATKTEKSIYQYQLQTRFGLLLLSVSSPLKGSEFLGSVNTRFENAELASKGLLWCGRNGKWNHLYTCSYDDAMQNLEYELTHILEPCRSVTG